VLTEAGRERLESVLPRHLQDIDDTLTGLLDAEELEAFLRTLRKIRNVVRPCATAGAAEPCGTSGTGEPVKTSETRGPGEAGQAREPATPARQPA
jgi:MarR family transcriptional regulator, 2-MHQ and catechol-resistance regulon repressor